MGLFDDLLYPDNKNRALRASQLGQDCGDFAVALATDKDKIDTILAQANDIIRAAYASFAQGLVPYEQVSLDSGAWVADVVDLIAPILTMKAANDALFAASRAWLLRQGRIGEAAFADLVGLPRWMEVGKVMGGIAAAVAVEVIIDGIEGAIQREKLQSAIHDLLAPRVRLKRHAMINARVLLTLQSVVAAYEAISGIPGLSLTKEQLDAIAANLVRQNAIGIDGFTEAAARDALSRFDHDRHAWTDEG